MTSAPGGELPAVLKGQLHLFVAFDWGEEVNLERAQRLQPADARDLPRRPRTPASFTYRPRPLRYGLGTVKLRLPELGEVATTAEATLFDFAGVSVALRLPLELSPERLRGLAGGL